MLKPWIVIMRPFNCFLITMCAIVGIMVDNAVQSFAHWPSLIMIFIGGWALSAAAMVLNDYFDVEIDRINVPDRPIPSGQIKEKHALIFGIILVVIGLLMSGGIELYEGLVWNNFHGVSLGTAIFNSIMLSIYSNYLKKYSIVGNLAVSVGVWFGFFYGDLVFNYQISWFTECLGIAAFLLNLGREVMKGIIDVEGDRANNVTTIATAFGSKWTSILSTLIYFSAAIVVLIPVFFLGTSWVFLASISIAIILALIVSVWVLVSQSEKSIRTIKTIVLYTMLIALVAFTLEGFLGEILPPLIQI